MQSRVAYPIYRKSPTPSQDSKTHPGASEPGPGLRHPRRARNVADVVNAILLSLCLDGRRRLLRDVDAGIRDAAGIFGRDADGSATFGVFVAGGPHGSTSVSRISATEKGNPRRTRSRRLRLRRSGTGCKIGRWPSSSGPRSSCLCIRKAIQRQCEAMQTWSDRSRTVRAELGLERRGRLFAVVVRDRRAKVVRCDGPEVRDFAREEPRSGGVRTDVGVGDVVEEEVVNVAVNGAETVHSQPVPSARCDEADRWIWQRTLRAGS